MARRFGPPIKGGEGADPHGLGSEKRSENGSWPVQVADKTNEITAIPKLFYVLTIKGAVVTIGAMGCPRGNAAKIIEKAADYVLTLKTVP